MAVIHKLLKLFNRRELDARLKHFGLSLNTLTAAEAEHVAKCGSLERLGDPRVAEGKRKADSSLYGSSPQRTPSDRGKATDAGSRLPRAVRDKGSAIGCVASVLTSMCIPHIVVTSSSPGIAFNIEVTGHHSGQTDLRLVASQAGQVVGTIDFVDYQGTCSVSMIHVDSAFRRKGVGSAMLRRLQQEYPDTDLDLGMLTGDGAALINAVPKTTTENPKVKELESELAEVTEKLNSYEEAANQIRRGATEEERNAFYNKVADWNELSDRKEQIEEELVGIRRQFVRYV